MKHVPRITIACIMPSPTPLLPNYYSKIYIPDFFSQINKMSNPIQNKIKIEIFKFLNEELGPV
jgi:hypothetical protein